MANIYKNAKVDLTTTNNTTVYTAPSNSRAIIKSILVSEDSNNADTITPTPWVQNKDYQAGSIVYITVKKVNYYFIAKTDGVDKNVPPPNLNFWLADQCAKTLEACSIRWGEGSPGAQHASRNNYLPFGGFPGVKRQ